MIVEKIRLKLDKDLESKGCQLHLIQKSLGSWAVVSGVECMDKNGVFSREPSPSSRTDKWLKENRFKTPEKAISVFRKKGNLDFFGIHVTLDYSVDYENKLKLLKLLS
jgi:hypothetical protein